MKPEETWKKVRGYSYDISNLGRVRSHYKNKIMILKSDRYGYPKVDLFKHGKRKTVNVHRLVGKAFIPNPNHKPQINHKSGNKFDNAVSNLEWVTAKENVRHSIITGLRKVKPKVNKPKRETGWNKRKVRIIETQEAFESIESCAKAINGRSRGISEVLGGRKKSHRGFHFEYIS